MITEDQLRKIVLPILFLMIGLEALAQKISGTIADTKGESLIGVNVYLKGTYDGATTDINGFYSFETAQVGEQILVASFIGFKSLEMPLTVRENVLLSLELKEDVNRLTGVTITAGSFEASDEKKAVILKPIDIAMTAGGTADITGALNTLPGTTTNGESGKLFVRGGTANEMRAFIDGVLVHNFYAASPNNVPSRSRFSPFLFKGTYFSTGGYSAEFGQALSSIISLTSNDLPDATRTDLSFMTVGGDLAHTQKWEKGSIYGQVQYTNFNPYNQLVKQVYDWEKGPPSTAGTFMLRQKMGGENMLKIYANYDRSKMILNYPSMNSTTPDYVDMTNNNLYLNASYRHAIGANSVGYIGASQGRMTENLLFNKFLLEEHQDSRHAKAYFSTDISNISLKVGGEVISIEHSEHAEFDDGTNNFSKYANTISAGFVESDNYITNDLTLRTGLRFANYSLFNESLLSPRISVALKTSSIGQVSAVFGKFHQLPSQDVLIRSPFATYETADHFMLSYQQINNGRTFRAEMYHKNYDRLVKFDPTDSYNPFVYTNSGKGYAQGLDIFWRDNKTLKNVDYWVTYSYLDTERDYRGFPHQAVTNFSARHNVSVVYKQFITKLKTQVGAAFRYNSGRPFNDPNKSKFNGSLTKDYADLSFNLAYLPWQNVIIYASATNLLGRNNVFGYEFEDKAGADNHFDSRAVTQPAQRFFFIGLFITLTKDKTKNNLKNL